MLVVSPQENSLLLDVNATDDSQAQYKWKTSAAESKGAALPEGQNTSIGDGPKRTSVLSISPDVCKANNGFPFTAVGTGLCMVTWATEQQPR